MKREHIIKLIIGILLCFLSIYIFRPGSYNNDTWGQYIHSTIGWYDDWWGPGLVALFKLMTFLTGKYYSVYLLQMAWYWVLLTCLSWNLPLRSFHYWAIAAIGMFFNFMPQYIMRDGLMVLSLGSAALIILRADFTKRRGLKISLVALFCLYAMILRPNALAAYVPFLLGVVYALKYRRTMLLPLSYAIGLTVLLFAAYNLTIYKVFQVNRVYPDYKLKLLDLVGISKLSGHNYLPACLKDSPSFSYQKLAEKYTPATMDDLYWDAESPVPAPDSTRNAATTESWKIAVKKEPILYLKNRGEGFLYYLRIKKRFTNEQYWNTNIEIDPNNPLNVQLKPHAARDFFSGIYDAIGKYTFFFAPWFWLLLNTAIFIFTIRRYQVTGAYHLKILACIQFSGIVFMLSQFPIYQHDRYFRYNYWTVFVVILSLGVWNDIRMKDTEHHQPADR
jgi:hypothetical protein